MGMATEFKEFIARGNVVDLAVGVVIGAAFGKIVSALVDNVIMPPLGLLIGGVDFARLGIVLKEATVDAQGNQVPAVVLAYGELVNALIQFLIIAFVIFMLVRTINRMHRPSDDTPAGPGEEILLLREIRDALKR